MGTILVWSGLMLLSGIGLVKNLKKRRTIPAYKFFAKQAEERARVRNNKRNV